MQYKQETAIPSSLQRRLYRIAGLFELADEEFVGIRNKRAALQQQTADEIAKGNKEISLSSASINEFVETWSAIPDVISAARKASFTMEDDDEEYPYFEDEEDSEMIPQIYKFARSVGISTVSGLEKALNPPNIDFLDSLFAQRTHGVWAATPAFLICLLLIDRFADRFDVDDLTDWHWSEDTAERVISTARQRAGRS